MPPKRFVAAMQASYKVIKEKEAEEGEAPEWTKIFTQPPTAQAFLNNAVIFYALRCLDIANVFYVAFKGNYYGAASLATGIVLPQIVWCFRTWSTSLAVDPTEVRKNMLYALLGLNRAVDAYKYKKMGIAPIWGFQVAEQHVRVGTGSAVTFVTNMELLLQSSPEELNASNLVLITTIVNVMTDFSSYMLDHKCQGPPQFFDAFRFWDVRNTPILSIMLTVIVDVTQVIYRKAMFTLVLYMTSWAALLGLVMVYAVAFFLLSARLVDSKLLPYGAQINFNIIQAFPINALHDCFWLEPMPYFSHAIEHMFTMRLVQLVVGAYMILESLPGIENKGWNMPVFWLLFYSWAVTALVWIVLNRYVHLFLWKEKYREKMRYVRSIHLFAVGLYSEDPQERAYAQSLGVTRETLMVEGIHDFAAAQQKELEEAARQKEKAEEAPQEDKAEEAARKEEKA